MVAINLPAIMPGPSTLVSFLQEQTVNTARAAMMGKNLVLIFFC
jgi:hypothetical protein